jgi:hypothetical protein
MYIYISYVYITRFQPLGILAHGLYSTLLVHTYWHRYQIIFLMPPSSYLSFVYIYIYTYIYTYIQITLIALSIAYHIPLLCFPPRRLQGSSGLVHYCSIQFEGNRSNINDD